METTVNYYAVATD